MNQVEQNYFKSIELLGAQIFQAFNEVRFVKLPSSYRRVTQLVACGMGGSQLPVDLLLGLFGRELKLSLSQVRDYSLPGFVDGRTLVFINSYSGGTEEALAAARVALKRKAKCFIIASNGDLGKLAGDHHLPSYLFKPDNNPSGQPRMGTGYVLGAMLNVLSQLHFLEIGASHINKLVAYSRLYFQKYQDLKAVSRLAGKLSNKIPVIVTSEFLQGNAHILTNQIHESSKQLALSFAIPELNHHLLEGLTFPKDNFKKLHFLFFNSEKYNIRNQRRYRVTQQILGRQQIGFTQLVFKGDQLSQAMEMLIFGSLLSYCLSKINKVDPNKIPWVNLFKSKMLGSS